MDSLHLRVWSTHYSLSCCYVHERGVLNIIASLCHFRYSRCSLLSDSSCSLLMLDSQTPCNGDRGDEDRCARNSSAYHGCQECTGNPDPAPGKAKRPAAPGHRPPPEGAAGPPPTDHRAGAVWKDGTSLVNRFTPEGMGLLCPTEPSKLKPPVQNNTPDVSVDLELINSLEKLLDAEQKATVAVPPCDGHQG